MQNWLRRHPLMGLAIGFAILTVLYVGISLPRGDAARQTASPTTAVVQAVATQAPPTAVPGTKPAPTTTPATAPTVAPKPEPTKPTGMTDAAYRAFITTHSTEMATSLQTFGSLINDPKVESAIWRSSVRMELLRWQRGYVSAQATTPPERYREAHLSYLAGLAKFNAASFDVLYGVDNPTSADAVARMDKAKREMAEGQALIVQAVSQMPQA